MSIRSMIAVLAVGCLVAGCIPEDSRAEDSAGTVSEESQPALEHPEVVAEFANGDNFKCKSVLLMGVPCVGFINIFPISLLIKNVKILNDLELEVLVKALNDLAILNKNEINVEKVLKNVEITALNVFINHLDIDIDIDDSFNCLINVLGVQQCK